MVIPVSHYLTLAAILFTTGVVGIFINRKNVIIILMSIELILLSVNINLVAFSRFQGDPAGMVFTLFAIAITVAEVALGLALVILLFRTKRTVMADQIDVLRG